MSGQSKAVRSETLLQPLYQLSAVRDEECLTKESVVSGGILYIVTILEDIKIGYIMFSFSNTESHELIKRKKQSRLFSPPSGLT